MPIRTPHSRITLALALAAALCPLAAAADPGEETHRIRVTASPGRLFDEQLEVTTEVVLAGPFSASVILGLGGGSGILGFLAGRFGAQGAYQLFGDLDDGIALGVGVRYDTVGGLGGQPKDFSRLLTGRALSEGLHGGLFVGARTTLSFGLTAEWDLGVEVAGMVPQTRATNPADEARFGDFVPPHYAVFPDNALPFGNVRIGWSF